MRNNETREDHLPSSPMRCIFDIVNGLAFIAMIVVGVVKWRQCPIEPYIPKCLVGSGISFLVVGILEKATLFCNITNSFRSIIGPILRFFFGTVIIVTFISLAVLIFGSFTANVYCDSGVYFFALFVLILFAVETVVLAAYVVIRKKRVKGRRSGGDDRGEGVDGGGGPTISYDL